MNKKQPVSIHVFPTWDAIELVQYDERAETIDKVSALPCRFDPATRQMSDPEQVSQTVRDLYTLNRVPFSTPTVLILPGFFTREIDLPTEFSREELRFALISEAERFYAFKKLEPQIDWIHLDASRLLYAAFPKPEIERYMKIFHELRIPLQAVDLGYFSMLRGLLATGAVRREAEEGLRWCLLSISDHSFFASVQEGMVLKKTTESPLSVTTDDARSIAQEIQQDFEAFAEQETFARVVIVNNTARIPNDLLVNCLGQMPNMVLLEQSAATLKSRGASDAQYPCSLEGLGGVFHHYFPDLPAFNFLPEIREDLASILHYRQEAIKWLLVSNGVVFICCLLLWAGMTMMLWQKDQERDGLIRQIGGMAASVNPTHRVEIDRKKYIRAVVAQNIRINNFLVHLGSLAKNKVWLEKVLVLADHTDEPPQIRVDGKTFDLERVNALLPPLNETLPDNGGLEVSGAAQNTTPDGEIYFTWSIQSRESNGTPNALPPSQPAPAPISFSAGVTPPGAPVTPATPGG